MNVFEQDLRELKKENERMKSALNNLNCVLERHFVVHNGVHFTQTEAIHRIIVRLGDLETLSGDSNDKICLSLEGDEED